MDGQTDRQMDMQVLVASRNFAKVPNKISVHVCGSEISEREIEIFVNYIGKCVS